MEEKGLVSEVVENVSRTVYIIIMEFGTAELYAVSKHRLLLDK